MLAASFSLCSPARAGPLAGLKPRRMNCGTVYLESMPELPEVEIAARRLGAALEGAEVESDAGAGDGRGQEPRPAAATRSRAMTIAGTRRVGKMPVVEFAGDR